MVSESKSALSWNSMPMRLRISNSSRSRMVVRSLPKAKTLPDSGLMSPIAVLSRMVLPLPAAPRITRDSLCDGSNEMSRNAATSSKDTVTFSKRRTDPFAPAGSFHH